MFLQMGEVFDFKVEEFANYFMNIKNRADGNRAKFIDLMKETLRVKLLILLAGISKSN